MLIHCGDSWVTVTSPRTRGGWVGGTGTPQSVFLIVTLGLSRPPVSSYGPVLLSSRVTLIKGHAVYHTSIEPIQENKCLGFLILLIAGLLSVRSTLDQRSRGWVQWDRREASTCSVKQRREKRRKLPCTASLSSTIRAPLVVCIIRGNKCPQIRDDVINTSLLIWRQCLMQAGPSRSI